MALTSTAKLQELFSLALEDRSRGYQDLVSNSNAILFIMKENGMWQPFSGPTIRERLLYAETGSYTRYSGYDFLNPTPKELINDAEWTPKLGAVSLTLSNEEILKNSGKAQMLGVMGVHMSAAEQELEDRFVEDLHSDGTADANQIGGLQLWLPTDPTTGTYGGISRVNNAIWRPTKYDADNDFSDIGTQVSSTTIKRYLDRMMIERSRGRKGPNLLASAKQHYEAYTAATVAIQRITDENGIGKLGFTSLRFYGAGKSVPMVLEGGIGSAMPDNVTYGIDSMNLKFRYHSQRNFQPFGGRQTPINQDAIVQHIGFFGELTGCNPLHMFKFYDSDTAS